MKTTRRFGRVAVLLSAAPTLALTSQAQVFSWSNPAGGLWADPANWGGSGYPAHPWDSAMIDLPGSYPVQFGPGTSFFIDGLTLANPDATLTLTDVSFLRLFSLTNEGHIIIHTPPGTYSSSAQLVFDGATSSLDGSGTITLAASPANYPGSAAIRSFGMLINGPTHTIEGAGLVDGLLTNNGFINANSSGHNLAVSAVTFNNKTLEATSGGVLLLQGPILVQQSGGKILADGGTVKLAGPAISGGDLRSTETGLITTVQYTPASMLDGVTLTGGLTVASDSTVQLGPLGLVNNGSILINHRLLTTDRPSQITGTGTIMLGGQLEDDRLGGPSALTLGPGQTLGGIGRFVGPMTIQGVLNSAPVVGARFSGDSLTLTSTTTVNMPLRYPQSSSGISGASHVDLAGSVDITFIPPVPPASAQLQAVIAGAIVGQFEHVTIQNVGPFGPAHLRYTPTRVFVVLCYANCDGSTASPALDVNDFICFQSKFAAGDSYANCDQSTIPPVLNVNDFLCFLQKFSAGCP